MGQLKLYQLNQIFSEKKSVYILDEPTNFLDDEHRKLVKSTLAELGKRDSIIILISHDMELWDLATDVLHLNGNFEAPQRLTVQKHRMMFANSEPS